MINDECYVPPGKREREFGLGCFVVGAIIGGLIGWWACDYFHNKKFGIYTLKTENGKARVENVLRIEGEPRYQINLNGSNIESLVEIRGFNIERNGKGFDAKAYGDELIVRRSRAAYGRVD